MDERSTDQTSSLADGTGEDILSGEDEQALVPGAREFELGWRGQRVFFLRTTVEDLPGDDEFLLDVACGQEAVVADSDESSREDVESEATKKLESIEGEKFFLLSVCVITPVEGDLSSLE